MGSTRDGRRKDVEGEKKLEGKFNSFKAGLSHMYAGARIILGLRAEVRFFEPPPHQLVV